MQFSAGDVTINRGEATPLQFPQQETQQLRMPKGVLVLRGLQRKSSRPEPTVYMDSGHHAEPSIPRVGSQSFCLGKHCPVLSRPAFEFLGANVCLQEAMLLPWFGSYFPPLSTFQILLIYCLLCYCLVQHCSNRSHSSSTTTCFLHKAADQTPSRLVCCGASGGQVRVLSCVSLISCWAREATLRAILVSAVPFTLQKIAISRETIGVLLIPIP